MNLRPLLLLNTFHLTCLKLKERLIISKIGSNIELVIFRSLPSLCLNSFDLTVLGALKNTVRFALGLVL